MNASQLRAAIESTGRETHFFDRKTMRFFGDTMANYGVRSVRVLAMTNEIDPETQKYTMAETDAWELYRRRPVKAGNQKSHYFAKSDYRKLFCVEVI